MIQITSSNFDAEVMQSALPVLLLWGMAIDVDSSKIKLEMLKQDATKVKTAWIDVDASPDLVMKYSIRQVPLVQLFKVGMAIDQDVTLSDKLLKQVS